MELKLEQVTKCFKDMTAVDHLTYTMASGVYGLLGVNGAGKTTLMRMLSTLSHPTEGMITLDGEDIWKMDARYRSLLGYLPQDFGYYPDFSAEDYLGYIASIKGIRRAASHDLIVQMLKKVGLYNVRRKKVSKFSGGMKRRLGIAQAMLNDPKILILDEPTAGLDPNERIRFRNLISDMAQDRLVLLSTHIVSDVEYIANEILLMKEGRIVADGDMKHLMDGVPVCPWIVRVDRQKANDYKHRYLIANERTEGNDRVLRLLSEEKPSSDAEQDVMNLEDVFLYYVGGKRDQDVLL